MLKKQNRLSKRSDFLKLKKEGAVKQSPFFGFVYLKNEEIDKPRFGFIISKRISKKAVDRNKIKRVLCEIIMKKTDFGNKKIEGIFLVRQAILKAKRNELEKEVIRILQNV